MAKIFDVQSEIHENPNRNNFDLTTKVHTSGKYGYIYPFLCQPVVPTDAWEINTAIGVNLMPMWYPTQTNMRFIVHYFYIPYRLLMDDWKNTLEGLEEHDFPYLVQPASFYETGSLADHLGVPTNYVLPHDTLFRYETMAAPYSQFHYFTVALSDSVSAGTYFQNFRSLTNNTADNSAFSMGTSVSHVFIPSYSPLVHIGFSDNILGGHIQNVGEKLFHISFKPLYVSTRQSGKESHVELWLFYAADDKMIDSADDSTANFSQLRFIKKYELFTLGNTFISAAGIGDAFASNLEDINSQIDNHKYVYAMLAFVHDDITSSLIVQFSSSSSSFVSAFPSSFGLSTLEGTDIEIAQHPAYCPYYMDSSVYPTTNRVKVRSFAFRAYEMVYNSYYRNSQGVQPFVVNGTTKYNDYLPTHASGADSYPYALHQRNWELDAYTSCLPSPQMGDAPLIGVTIDGSLRITHDDGRTSEVQLRDLDGAAGLGVTSSSIDPEHPEDMRSVISLASSGMTIADFRAGNALTRFLETSLRTGFRYADFIFGHFGKSPSHQELDMPIFLGGYTQLVEVSKISNVAASENALLGDFAGTGSSFDGARHPIKHYFDDYGLFLGVMCLVPDPAYSQVLPKHFTYSERLDFYFPEFSQLGLQPITYEELCPIQSYAEYVDGDTSKLLTDVFGYQRPNHDLVWLPDTCHGLFRTSLHDSVINRRFGYRPELGDDFLRIKPEECNGIFSVTEKNDDVWTGQIICSIKAQRPIPRIVIPSLGR